MGNACRAAVQADGPARLALTVAVSAGSFEAFGKDAGPFEASGVFRVLPHPPDSANA